MLSVSYTDEKQAYIRDIQAFMIDYWYFYMITNKFSKNFMDV